MNANQMKINQIYNIVSKLNSQYLCLICDSLTKDGIFTCCNHLYCRNCLEIFLLTSDICKKCHKSIKKRDVYAVIGWNSRIAAIQKLNRSLIEDLSRDSLPESSPLSSSCSPDSPSRVSQDIIDTYPDVALVPFTPSLPHATKFFNASATSKAANPLRATNPVILDHPQTISLSTSEIPSSTNKETAAVETVANEREQGLYEESSSDVSPLSSENTKSRANTRDNEASRISYPPEPPRSNAKDSDFLGRDEDCIVDDGDKDEESHEHSDLDEASTSSQELPISQRYGANIKKYENPLKKLSKQRLAQRAGNANCATPKRTTALSSRLAITGQDKTPNFTTKISKWLGGISNVVDAKADSIELSKSQDPFAFIGSPVVSRAEGDCEVKKSKKHLEEILFDPLPSSDDSVDIVSHADAVKLAKAAKADTAKSAKKSKNKQRLSSHELEIQKSFEEIDSFKIISQNTFDKTHTMYKEPDDITVIEPDQTLNHRDKPPLPNVDSLSRKKRKRGSRKSAAEKPRITANLKSKQIGEDVEDGDQLCRLDTPAFGSSLSATSECRGDRLKRNVDNLLSAYPSTQNPGKSSIIANGSEIYDQTKTRVTDANRKCSVDCVEDKSCGDVLRKNVEKMMPSKPVDKKPKIGSRKSTLETGYVHETEHAHETGNARENKDMLETVDAHETMCNIDSTAALLPGSSRSVQVQAGEEELNLADIRECDQPPSISCSVVKGKKLVYSWRRQSLRFKRQLIIARKNKLLNNIAKEEIDKSIADSNETIRSFKAQIIENNPLYKSNLKIIPKTIIPFDDDQIPEKEPQDLEIITSKPNTPSKIDIDITDDKEDTTIVPVYSMTQGFVVHNSDNDEDIAINSVVKEEEEEEEEEFTEQNEKTSEMDCSLNSFISATTGVSCLNSSPAIPLEALLKANDHESCKIVHNTTIPKIDQKTPSNLNASDLVAKSSDGNSPRKHSSSSSSTLVAAKDASNKFKTPPAVHCQFKHPSPRRSVRGSPSMRRPAVVSDDQTTSSYARHRRIVTSSRPVKIKREVNSSNSVKSSENSGFGSGGIVVRSSEQKCRESHEMPSHSTMKSMPVDRQSNIDIVEDSQAMVDFEDALLLLEKEIPESTKADEEIDKDCRDAANSSINTKKRETTHSSNISPSRDKCSTKNTAMISTDLSELDDAYLDGHNPSDEISEAVSSKPLISSNEISSLTSSKKSKPVITNDEIANVVLSPKSPSNVNISSKHDDTPLNTTDNLSYINKSPKLPINETVYVHVRLRESNQIIIPETINLNISDDKSPQKSVVMNEKNIESKIQTTPAKKISSQCQNLDLSTQEMEMILNFRKSHSTKKEVKKPNTKVKSKLKINADCDKKSKSKLLDALNNCENKKEDIWSPDALLLNVPLHEQPSLAVSDSEGGITSSAACKAAADLHLGPLNNSSDELLLGLDSPSLISQSLPANLSESPLSLAPSREVPRSPSRETPRAESAVSMERTPSPRRDHSRIRANAGSLSGSRRRTKKRRTRLATPPSAESLDSRQSTSGKKPSAVIENPIFSQNDLFDYSVDYIGSSTPIDKSQLSFTKFSDSFKEINLTGIEKHNNKVSGGKKHFVNPIESDSDDDDLILMSPKTSKSSKMSAGYRKDSQLFANEPRRPDAESLREIVKLADEEDLRLKLQGNLAPLRTGLAEMDNIDDDLGEDDGLVPSSQIHKLNKTSKRPADKSSEKKDAEVEELTESDLLLRMMDNLNSPPANPPAANPPATTSPLVSQPSVVAAQNSSKQLKPTKPKKMNSKAGSNKSKKRKLQEPDSLKRPHWNFVTSGFRGAAGRLLNGKCDEFKELTGCQFLSKYNKDVTHLIVNSNDLSSTRTFKYFQAISDHKWIVSIQWILDCLDTNTIINENKYEINKFANEDEIHYAPERSRTTRNKILDKYEICCYGKFINHSKADIESLVLSLNGTLIATPSEFLFSEDKTAVIVMEDDNNIADEAILEAEQAGIPAVIKEWLLNTIGSYRTFDLENYLII